MTQKEMIVMIAMQQKFLAEHIEYIAENISMIPVIIEQAALKNGLDPIDLMKDLLSMMEAIRDQEGPAELLY